VPPSRRGGTAAAPRGGAAAARARGLLPQLLIGLQCSELQWPQPLLLAPADSRVAVLGAASHGSRTRPGTPLSSVLVLQV
jgi:hypothetical protein